jgi:hypothetical protein
MDESAYSTLTESEKKKLRKQAKHYVSKDNLLYYVGAKGETRRVVRETEKHIGSFVLAIPIVPLVKEAGQIGPKPNRPQSNRPQVKIIEELKLSSKYSYVLYQ